MEFTVEKSHLLKSLYFAQGIADKKATMPILANVLLRTEGTNQLVLAATDLNMTITSEIPCQVLKEGSVTCSAKHLYDLVKSIPSDRINLKQIENNYIQIQAGKISYKLVGLSNQDFPKLPDAQKVKFSSVDSATLKDLIEKTFFSVSTDETRYHLNGILFECTGNEDAIAKMVSTDGHRLSKCERIFTRGLKLEPGVLIPRKGLIEIKRALEDAKESVEIGIMMGHLFLKMGHMILTVKLQEAQFPPYAQVIPKSHQRSAIIKRGQFLDSLKRVSLMASDKTWGIKLAFLPDTLKIEAENPELGHGQEEVPIKYSGSNLQIGFNGKYLIDVLTEMDTEEVRFELNGELDPGLLRPADESDRPGNHYLGVIMPMRI